MRAGSSWFETAQERLPTMREHEPRGLRSPLKARYPVRRGFSSDHNRLWNTGSSRAMTAVRRSPPYTSPEQRIEQQFHVQNDDDAGHDPRRGGDEAGERQLARLPPVGDEPHQPDGGAPEQHRHHGPPERPRLASDAL